MRIKGQATRLTPPFEHDDDDDDDDDLIMDVLFVVSKHFICNAMTVITQSCPSER